MQQHTAEKKRNNRRDKERLSKGLVMLPEADRKKSGFPVLE